jgi:hypothetical protein
MVERMNRTVGQMLRQYVSEHQIDWDEWLPLCNLAYNSSLHSTTKYTPFFLMFGRELRLPVELVLPPCEPMSTAGAAEDTDSEVDTSKFAERLRQSLRQVYQLVRTNLQQATRQCTS